MRAAFSTQGQGSRCHCLPTGRGLPKKGQVNRTKVYAMLEDISKSKFFLRLFFSMERIPHENPSSFVIINLRDLIRFFAYFFLGSSHSGGQAGFKPTFGELHNLLLSRKQSTNQGISHFITINMCAVFAETKACFFMWKHYQI